MNDGTAHPIRETDENVALEEMTDDGPFSPLSSVVADETGVVVLLLLLPLSTVIF